MEYYAFSSNMRPMFYVEAEDLAQAVRNADLLALEGERMYYVKPEDEAAEIMHEHELEDLRAYQEAG